MRQRRTVLVAQQQTEGTVTVTVLGLFQFVAVKSRVTGDTSQPVIVAAPNDVTVTLTLTVPVGLVANTTV